MTSVAIVGASGTLGRVVDAVVSAEHGFEVVARLGSGNDLDEMLTADVIVDVTLPAVSPTVVELAVEHGRRILVGTSGWNSTRLARLEARLADAPEAGVVVVPNFSLGSVLATHLAQKAARHFDSIEIVEAHHAGKVDSPSGTAVRTAELIEAARSDLGPVVAPHTDQRARGQQVASIPVHSLRLAGVLARQEVVFGGVGETLTITHQTHGHASYEAGIRLGVRATAGARGLIVGLDALIGLD